MAINTTDSDRCSPDPGISPNTVRWLRTISRYLGGLVALLGVLVLIGWALNNNFLKAIFPNTVSMKANTAVCFLLTGLSLLLVQGDRIGKKTAFARYLAASFAIIVALIGALTILEYLSGWYLGIDNWLFNEPEGAIGTSHRGRMAPSTALNFLLIGTALLTINVETRGRIRPAQILMLLEGLLSLGALTSYLYGGVQYYGLLTYTVMAVNTSVAFSAVFFSFFLAMPDRGFAAIAFSSGLGGTWFRRLMPIAVLVVIVLGWLQLQGVKSHLFNAASGTALFATASTTILAAVFLVSSQRLNSADTARKRSEQSIRDARDYAEGIINSTHEALIVLDNDLRVISANPSFCRTFKVTQEETEGQFLFDLGNRQWDIPALKELLNEIIPHKTSLDEFEVRHDFQHIGHRIMLLNARRVERGSIGIPLILLAIDDITQRKQAEEETKKYSAELATVNKEMEAFSYSVSHDLRAPLRSIDGFSQALLEDYADTLAAQGKDYLQRVRAATQRMGLLIDDLLSLSRVTRSEMKPEAVNLSALAGTIAVELQKTQPERQVEFAIAAGLTAKGDARLLRVALENLLGNAWKYTSKHPLARIEFGVTPKDGTQVYFVRDDGAGFDMAYADKLFAPFQRLHSPGEFPGSGIGLATVQRIIHRHGGGIWAEGEVGKGATFYFTL